jgi:hypothetical protein
MTRYKTHEEIEREYISVLGPDLGKVYHELESEHVWLRDKWREYRTLFGGSASRVDLLNRAAARFFGQLQDIWWEDVLLHICRLTDPRKVGGHRQLTVRQLSDLIPEGTARDRVEPLVSAACDASAFARDWRNRHIAHRSFERATNPLSRALEHASRASVEDAIGALDRVMNEVQLVYFDAEMSYDGVGGVGDAGDLLLVLNDGVRARDAREERLRCGDPLPEDWAARTV